MPAGSGKSSRPDEDVDRRRGGPAGPVEALMQQADSVTIEGPLDASTRGLIGTDAIARMQPGSFLINTARGGIVDEQALKDALAAGRIGGAALDVFAVEPPVDPELLRLPNFFGTPHIGGGTSEAVLAMGRAAIAGYAGDSASLGMTSKI